jgi:hypothetical protein
MPPENIRASDGSLSKAVRVEWDACAGATSYRLLRGFRDGGAVTELASAGLTELARIRDTAYDDTTAWGSTYYYYCVQACDQKGCGEPSAYDRGHYGTHPSEAQLVQFPMILRGR